MAVTISPTSLPNGQVNTAYSQTLTASGGVSPYTYAVTTGSLPDGLTLTAGVISGTPSEASASVGFTVTATDSTADTPITGTQAYTVAVSAAAAVAAYECPSVACTGVGPVYMQLIQGATYLCPRCEQQSVLTDGAMVLAPGYHA